MSAIVLLFLCVYVHMPIWGTLICVFIGIVGDILLSPANSIRRRME